MSTKIIPPSSGSSGGGLKNWSTTEQEAGFTDASGNTVYQKTYTGTIATSGDADVVLETASAARAILDVKGTTRWPSSGTESTPIPYSNQNRSIYFKVYLLRTSYNIVLIRDTTTFSNIDYEVTVWYTKA